MAGLRDRPLMRAALLAGAAIAASVAVLLTVVDRGPVSPPRFDSMAFVPTHADVHASTSKSEASAAASSAARALPKQIGFAPPPSKKKSDMTLVVMVPDLPPSENPEPPQSSGWTVQGSAAPVSGANFQPPGPIAMSAVGGISTPLTSPAGGSLPSSPSTAPAISHPAASSPVGVSPAEQPGIVTHNGFVLLAGGQGNGQFALSSAELFDPAKNAFAAASSMKDARTDHTATVLPGGKILVAGGTTAASTLGSTLRSAELFDPVTGIFTATGAMKATRARHSATLIASGPLAGNVLIAGGLSDESGGDVATAELYDPVTGQFTTTGAMSMPRENHTATWLSPSVVSGSLAGSVLVAGGGDVSAPTDNAEVFNPQTAAFSPVGAMTTARAMQSAILLQTGKVLIAGGQSSDTNFLVSAELFDPAHATFAVTGSMHNFHAGATATALENGSALIAGGRSSFGDLYDPARGTFSATGRMITDVAESTSTLIR